MTVKQLIEKLQAVKNQDTIITAISPLSIMPEDYNIIDVEIKSIEKKFDYAEIVLEEQV